jgi:hypothetical protein
VRSRLLQCTEELVDIYKDNGLLALAQDRIFPLISNLATDPCEQVCCCGCVWVRACVWVGGCVGGWVCVGVGVVCGDTLFSLCNGRSAWRCELA